jgi:hypothetical protein
VTRLIPRGSALQLALLRIVAPAMVLTTTIEVRHAPRFATLPPGLRVAPEGLGWFVAHVPITSGVATAAQAVCVFSALCAIAGLRARTALVAVTLSTFYLLALGQLSGAVWHDMHLVWMPDLKKGRRGSQATACDQIERLHIDEIDCRACARIDPRRSRTGITQARDGGTTSVPTPSGTLNNELTNNQGGVGTSVNLSAIAYQDVATGYPFLTLLDAHGSQAGGFIQLSSSLPVSGSRVAAVGGAAAGFIGLWSSGSSIYSVLAPASADAGTIAVDGSVGGFSPSFSIPTNADLAQVISDDTGGAGGIGIALRGSNRVAFLYVQADGVTHLPVTTALPISVQMNTNAIAITNFGGSFGVSSYSPASHSTQMVTSGCGM